MGHNLYRQLALQSIIKMSSTNDELACVYAALILADDKVAVTGDKINAILKAANYEVAPYWPGLFANALEDVNVTELVTSLGSAPAAAAAAEPAKKKEKTPEPSEDEDMGFGLFD